MMRLRVGDPDAADQVFRRFVGRLIALAYRQLHSRCGRREDAEDVVQSAFKSFFARYRRGEFDFDDWDELWGLLTIITLRRCRRRREFLRAGRRDITRETARLGEAGAEDWLGAIDREPSPPQAAMLAELVDQLLEGLRPPHREIVEMCLLGYTAQ